MDFVRVFESSVMMTFIPRCSIGVKTSVSSGVQPLSTRQVKSALPLMLFACGGANFISFFQSAVLKYIYIMKWLSRGN